MSLRKAPQSRTPEIDFVRGAGADPAAPASPDDATPEPPQRPVSKAGDLWQIGRHRLVCGDARDRGAYRAPPGEERCDLIFTDPPYNVPIDGHVSGLRAIKHREFAMATGKMSSAAFTGFLSQSLGPMGEVCRDGATSASCWQRSPLRSPS